MHFDMVTIELRIYIYNTHTIYKYININKYICTYIYKDECFKTSKSKRGKNSNKRTTKNKE